MPTAQHQTGVVLKNSAPIFLARVVGNDGAYLVQANLSSIAYSIFTLNPNDLDSETAVAAAHTATSLTVSAVVWDTLQLDNLWKNDDGDYVDATGYNFRFQPSIASSQAFPVGGALYGVRVTMTPSSGQKVVLYWKVRCI
jgi:hypothetical protein